MKAPCPKCGGRMVTVPADWRAPAHDKCFHCGLYLEHEPVVVMPDIPPAEMPGKRNPKVAEMSAADRLELNQQRLQGNGYGTPKRRRLLRVLI